MKLIKIIPIFLIIFSLGCITVEDGLYSSPINSNVKVYVQIEEKSAVFDFSEVEIKVGDKTISEFNKPIFVGYARGDNGEVNVAFIAEARVKNWYGKNGHAKNLITFKLPYGEEVLVTLELYYQDESIRIRADRDKSGVIGESIPKDVFLSPEEALLEEIRGLYGKIPEDILREIERNKKLSSFFLQKYSETGNITYLISYRDSSYVLRAFGELAKWKALTPVDLKVFNLTLKANNEYYSRFTSPQKDFFTVIFSDSTPYYSPIKIKGALNTSLPFIYYRGRGINLYAVSALHWVDLYFQRGDNEKALRLLDELQGLLYYGNYNGEDYALFLNYFHFENSSVPWVSGYAQGLGAGLYAKAYQITNNKTYLKTANLLLNSFDLPLEMNGFVADTKYGPWYLEYNYNSNELVLNGHIIALQGLYYYWEITKDEKAWKLFKAGVESTKRALPIFDTNSWSRYSNIHGDASEFYHRLHIRLLKWLYDVTGDEYFLNYARKWNNYLIYRGLKPEDLG
ncbi:D-glucuronyl C5-epimerase family protein [Thermococcus alcaliphilus]|uniref:D-glucuronyl C5-epimerase family protein n=1 Tax=Thermococcus alcaliphilus TaxID=139207 RepID=UPI0020900BEA|nr:D-glucuronyl C5-epimerase family protein [Thermococcus alcaliphilus]MCO6041001.1 D-glucuronyl C5-epimerase family protein [Thermococcus alcaliphilus]